MKKNVVKCFVSPGYVESFLISKFLETELSYFSMSAVVLTANLNLTEKKPGVFSSCEPVLKQNLTAAATGCVVKPVKPPKTGKNHLKQVKTVKKL